MKAKRCLAAVVGGNRDSTLDCALSFSVIPNLSQDNGLRTQKFPCIYLGLSVKS